MQTMSTMLIGLRLQNLPDAPADLLRVLPLLVERLVAGHGRHRRAYRLQTARGVTGRPEWAAGSLVHGATRGDGISRLRGEGSPAR